MTSALYFSRRRGSTTSDDDDTTRASASPRPPALRLPPLSALPLPLFSGRGFASGFSPPGLSPAFSAPVPFAFFSSAMIDYSPTTAGISSPLLAPIRTFLPPSSSFERTRVPLPVFGSTGITLQAQR